MCTAGLVCNDGEMLERNLIDACNRQHDRGDNAADDAADHQDRDGLEHDQKPFHALSARCSVQFGHGL